MNVTIVAATPEDAYKVAVDKYGKNIEILSAKHIQDPLTKSIACEITITLSQEDFFAQGFIKKDTIKNSGNQKQTIYNEKITKVKKLFEGKGIQRDWLNKTLATLNGSVAQDDEQLMVGYLLEEIDETIQIQEEEMVGQKIIMFVGPTGVGKTTTVAKLAARYAYMLSEPRSVALINLDNFKIGAFEQLQYFADVMKLQHYRVNNADEFQEVFEKVLGFDVILIDTAGMSPFDTQKLIKIVEYLNANSKIDIEVNLVISAAIKYEDAFDIYQTFSFLNLESIILTKLDETKYLGYIISFLLSVPVKLSYLSIGQSVPEDLLVADKEYLLRRFIGDLDG